MKICLFDIDGTLLSSGGAGKAALESALTEDFGIALRANIPYSGRTDRAIIRELFHVHGVSETPENLDKIFQGYLRRLPASLTQHQGRVLPGIHFLLDALPRRGVAVGLLTGNVRAGARAKLGHFGIFDHFRFGGFGDHHFDRDDVAREALAEVHRHHGPEIEPDRIWVIGDTPLDVRCARAIGARVIAVATGVHTLDQLKATNPDMAFQDLESAEAILESIPKS